MTLKNKIGLYIVAPFSDHFEDWAAGMCLANPRGPVVGSGKDWKEWAGAFAQWATQSAYHIPDPHDFSDWMEWAYALANAVHTGY